MSLDNMGYTFQSGYVKSLLRFTRNQMSTLFRNFLLSSLVSIGFVATIAPAMAGSADSMSDTQVYSAVIDQSANSCNDYSGVKAEPDIRKIPIPTLRTVYDRNVMLCPNAHLSGKSIAVVWYGNHKAMVWNPDAPGAADIMVQHLTAMAQDDAFPAGIMTWSAKGDAMTGAAVPMFETNCVGASKDCDR